MLKRIVFIILVSCLLLLASPGGDYLDESFEGVGTPAGWDTNIGAGSVVDFDNTDIARPPTGGAEVLKIQKVNPNYDARANWNDSAERATTYSTFYVHFSDFGDLANNNNIDFYRGMDASWGIATMVALRRSASNYFLRFTVYTGGSEDIYDSSNISEDTWYRIDVKYDATGDAWEWRIDSVSQDSGGLTDAHRTGMRYWQYGNVGSSYTLTAYFDLCNIDSTGYVTFDGNGAEGKSVFFGVNFQ